MRRSWKPIVGLAVIALALGACSAPLSDGAGLAAGWLRGAGVAGLAVITLAYVGAALAGLPVGAVTMSVGVAYGVGRGFAIITPVALLAALLGLAVGRTLMRRRIVKRMQHDRRFRAIDRAVAEDGLKITILMRLAPVLPFGLGNYALAATSVKTGDYAIGTVIGQMPSTLALLYVGSGAHDDVAFTWWIGIAVTAIAAVVITRMARRALGEVEVPA